MKHKVISQCADLTCFILISKVSMDVLVILLLALLPGLCDTKLMGKFRILGIILGIHVYLLV